MVFVIAVFAIVATVSLIILGYEVKHAPLIEDDL